MRVFGFIRLRRSVWNDAILSAHDAASVFLLALAIVVADARFIVVELRTEFSTDFTEPVEAVVFLRV